MAGGRMCGKHTQPTTRASPCWLSRRQHGSLDGTESLDRPSESLGDGSDLGVGLLIDLVKECPDVLLRGRSRHGDTRTTRTRGWSLFRRSRVHRPHGSPVPLPVMVRSSTVRHRAFRPPL